MLMPKKVKYRKQQRGRMKGKAWRGSELSFGVYGLKVLECGYITDRQIEAIGRCRGLNRRQAASFQRAAKFDGHGRHSE